MPVPEWEVFDKETIDEIIFKTANLRNRILLELMARGGLRIGEVLKLTPGCIKGKKLILHSPKSGKDKEFACITAKFIIVYRNTLTKIKFLFTSDYFRFHMKQRG